MTFCIGIGMMFKDKEFFRAGRAMQEWNERGFLASVTAAGAESVVLMRSESARQPLSCEFRPANCNQGLLTADGRTQASVGESCDIREGLWPICPMGERSAVPGNRI